VFKDFEFDMAVGIGMLGYPTQKTAVSNDTANQTAGSQLLTLLQQVKQSDQ